MHFSSIHPNDLVEAKMGQSTTFCIAEHCLLLILTEIVQLVEFSEESVCVCAFSFYFPPTAQSVNLDHHRYKSKQLSYILQACCHVGLSKCVCHSSLRCVTSLWCIIYHGCRKGERHKWNISTPTGTNIHSFIFIQEKQNIDKACTTCLNDLL